MKSFVIATFILSCFFSLQAQVDPANHQIDNDQNKIRIYKTWVSKINESLIDHGVLYDVADSSILVSSSFSRKDYSTGNFTISTINFNQIDNIKIRPKNAMARGALIGLMTGIAAGVLAGLIDGDDNPDDWIALTAEDKAVIGAYLFGMIGAGVGSFAGLIQLKIPINGNRDNYSKNIIRLRRYTIR